MHGLPPKTGKSTLDTCLKPQSGGVGLPPKTGNPTLDTCLYRKCLRACQANHLAVLISLTIEDSETSTPARRACSRRSLPALSFPTTVTSCTCTHPPRRPITSAIFLATPPDDVVTVPGFEVPISIVTPALPVASTSWTQPPITTTRFMPLPPFSSARPLLTSPAAFQGSSPSKHASLSAIAAPTAALFLTRAMFDLRERPEVSSLTRFSRKGVTYEIRVYFVECQHTGSLYNATE